MQNTTSSRARLVCFVSIRHIHLSIYPKRYLQFAIRLSLDQKDLHGARKGIDL
jgi:hypothetical protein